MGSRALWVVMTEMHDYRRIRRLLVLVALLVTALPASAPGQATADGVLALTHGDAASALRLLRPLTEGATPDPVAQFFVAAMLDSTGGSGQWLQACRLYRQSATIAHAFSASATILADVVQQLFVPDAARCSGTEDPTWRGPAPARFELAPGHVVTIDAAGFSVHVGGEVRAEPNLGGQHWRFLPTRYTRIAGPDAGSTRHFIEHFWWMPDDVLKPTTWGLVWNVTEIVGLEAIVATDPMVVDDATEEPRVAPTSPTQASLRVAADGAVERVVVGPHARTVAVPAMRTRTP